MTRCLARSAVVVCLTFVLACGGEAPPPSSSSAPSPSSGGPEASGLRPLPELDLSAAEATARQQLEAQRGDVEVLLQQPDADPAAMAQAWGDLGLLYLTYDFLDAAEVCFRNAVELQGDDYRWHYLLGYLLMTRGQPEAAVPSYEAALDRRADFLPALLRLGRVHLALGQPEVAKPWFERALAVEPEIAAAHEGLANVAVAAGDLTAAVDRFERALALEPAATALHYALAQAHRDLGDLDRARHHLERSGDVTPRVIDPLINPLASKALSVQFYLVQGAEALDDDDFAAAAGAYRSALQLDATNLVAAQGLAAALESLGDLTGARQALMTALAAASQDAVPAVDGGSDAAGPAVDVASRPNDDLRRAELAAVQRILGRLALLAGDDAEVIISYRQSLALQPNQPGVLLRVANALARQGHFEDAIRHYDRLIELEPQWAPAVWERRGTAWVNLGRRDEAVADFQRAVEASPDDPRLRRQFAAALEHLGDTASAVEQRQAAQELPESEAARLSMLLKDARERLRQQEFGQAIDRFNEVLGLTPDAHDVRRELADVLGHTRQYAAAIAEYDRVLEALPKHEAARRGRIVALVLSGRLGEARLALQEALRIFPRHRGFALTQVRLLSMAPDPAVRDGDLALRIAQKVHRDRADGASQQALALALAAAGEFAAALDLQRHWVAAVEGGPAPLVEAETARLRAFERGEAWTAQSADEILLAIGAE